jgi:hypothetical protein
MKNMISMLGLRGIEMAMLLVSFRIVARNVMFLMFCMQLKLCQE